VKSAGRLDSEGIGSRKGLRLILTVWDLKSVEGFPREGSTPSLGIASFFEKNPNGDKRIWEKEFFPCCPPWEGED